jgi:hypothetical protein
LFCLKEERGMRNLERDRTKKKKIVSDHMREKKGKRRGKENNEKWKNEGHFSLQVNCRVETIKILILGKNNKPPNFFD